MTGFEKLTIEELEKFIKRNEKLPLRQLIEDASMELLRKRIEASVQWHADVKSGAAWTI